MSGASERDRTSDLLITNHARCGANCKRDNCLAGYFRISCPRFVHFHLNENGLPGGLRELPGGGHLSPSPDVAESGINFPSAQAAAESFLSRDQGNHQEPLRLSSPGS
jgi:hypothetical protein